MTDTCKHCKYYYSDEDYCIFFKREKEELLGDDCEFKKTGEFNNRFYIKAYPLGYSTGYYFMLIDRLGELTDFDDDFLTFKYEDDADSICMFLNKYIKLQ